MHNLTVNLNQTGELLYEYMYGGIGGHLILYSSTFLFSFVGPILMLGIVIFEMYGGDSQKRTIVNRLLSAILINTAIWSVLMGIIKIVRSAIGLIDYDLAMFLRLSSIFLRISIFIFYDILMLSRFLFIVVWRRMRGVQDKFWMLFLAITTYAISFWFVGCIYMTGIHPNSGRMLSLTKASDQNETVKHRYFYSLFNAKMHTPVNKILS